MPLTEVNANIAAGSPGMSPFAKSPKNKSPAPPPPPPETEVDTVANSSETALFGATKSLRSSLPAYAAGHLAFLVLYVSGGSLISISAWCLLAALIVNGPATMLRKPSKPVQPFAAEEVTKHVLAALNGAVGVFNRYKSGEPMLCFQTAVGAYAVALVAPCLPQPLVLAWMAYSLLAPDRAILEQIVASAPPAALQYLGQAKTKALELYNEHTTQERLTSLRAKLPEPVLDALTKAQAVGKAHAGLVAFWPLAPLFVWGFVFSWFNKVLSLGMGLLAYRAWASKEANELLANTAKMYGEKTARTARRMSLAAGDLIRRKSGASKPKEL